MNRSKLYNQNCIICQKIISQVMRVGSTLLIIVFVMIVSVTAVPNASIKCMKQLIRLKTLYQTNKALFYKQMAPYMLFSGKQVDDLGFPKMCQDNSFEYTTVKIDTKIKDKNITNHPDYVFSFYYGFCFTQLCAIHDLNQQGSKFLNYIGLEFIIENIFEDSPLAIQKVAFYDAQLKTQFSSTALIVCLVFVMWMGLAMVGLLAKWFRQCNTVEPIEIEVAIPLKSNDQKQPQEIIQVYEQPVGSEFLQSISIGRKWHHLWRSQQSNKIKQFSYFKILAFPLIIYGYYFYLCNQGSFNIFSFNSQIYPSFYSKIATFTYYLPDIFFFISGYLFTKKIFTLGQFEVNKPLLGFKCLIVKLIRLYPIYLVCLLVFWLVLPALHAGPLWMIFQEHIDTCDTNWWRNLLLIDNLFSDGCFSFSWWVQAQIQYTLLAVITFTIMFYHKPLGSILLYSQILASYILLFTTSSKLPIQLQITLNPQSEHYFKSFHSHLPFYLTGIILALILKKQSSRKLIINYYFKNTIVLLLGIFLAIGSILMVLFRPISFGYEWLGVELALCRIGVLFGFLVYCMPGLVKERANKTVIHKLAYLTYPTILISGVAVIASFWGLETFPYTSYRQLLSNLVPNLCISIIIGIILHLLFNFRPVEKKPARIL